MREKHKNIEMNLSSVHEMCVSNEKKRNQKKTDETLFEYENEYSATQFSFW